MANERFRGSWKASVTTTMTNPETKIVIDRASDDPVSGMRK